MRKFKADIKSASQWVRVMAGGMPTSGKTHFAATFPKPLFISDEAEGGYKTLFGMDPDYWWDPKVVPEVWAQSDMTDFPKAVTEIQGMVSKSGKLPWETMVVDSISIYTERVLGEMKLRNPGEDNRQRYGALTDALRLRVLQVNALPMHVVWLCHVTSEGELTLPAKAAATVPAYMDYKWLCHVQPPTVRGGVPDFQLRTKAFNKSAWLGGRNGMNPLPDPAIPSFKYIAGCLGLPIQPVSPACPVFGGIDYRNGISWE